MMIYDLFRQLVGGNFADAFMFVLEATANGHGSDLWCPDAELLSVNIMPFSSPPLSLDFNPFL